MQLHDTLTLDAPKTIRDGYMAVRAKAARAGVYDYASSEVGGTAHGFKDTDTIKVYRAADEVFKPSSVASFIARPVTNGHPKQPVTMDNWKEHTSGAIMGAKWEVGDYMAFDLMIMDGATIKDIQAGKRELSNGYSCELVWGDGVAPDGTAYNARQTNIIGNHVAIVDKGRAGDACRIGDSGGKLFALCDANPNAIKVGDIKMKITLDGLSVTLTDAAEVQAAFDAKAAIIVAKDAELATAKTESVKLAAETVAKDAEIVALKAQVADNAITPAKLRDAAKAYADVTGKAKALGVATTDAMDTDAVMKAVVDAKMPGKEYTADQVALAFEILTKDAKASDGNIVALTTPLATNDALADIAAARAARNLALSQAHKA
jgi:hypothetical protein